jgi:hypothetical protein
VASIEGDARVLQLDVTDQASIGAVAERIRPELGRLDVLVNNAGIMNAGRPGDGLEEQLNAGRLSAVALDEVRTVFDTNVFGVIAVTKALLPLLREAPAPRIVNIASSGGVAHAQLRPSQPAPCEVRDLCDSSLITRTSLRYGAICAPHIGLSTAVTKPASASSALKISRASRPTYPRSRETGDSDRGAMRAGPSTRTPSISHAARTRIAPSSRTPQTCRSTRTIVGVRERRVDVPGAGDKGRIARNGQPGSSELRTTNMPRPGLLALHSASGPRLEARCVRSGGRPRA